MAMLTSGRADRWSNELRMATSAPSLWLLPALTTVIFSEMTGTILQAAGVLVIFDTHEPAPLIGVLPGPEPGALSLALDERRRAVWDRRLGLHIARVLLLHLELRFAGGDLWSIRWRHHPSSFGSISAASPFLLAVRSTPPSNAALTRSRNGSHSVRQAMLEVLQSSFRPAY